MDFVLKAEKVIPYQSGWKARLSLFGPADYDGPASGVVTGLHQVSVIAPDGDMVMVEACEMFSERKSEGLIRKMVKFLDRKNVRTRTERANEKEFLDWNFVHGKPR